MMSLAGVHGVAARGAEVRDRLRSLAEEEELGATLIGLAGSVWRSDRVVRSPAMKWRSVGDLSVADDSRLLLGVRTNNLGAAPGAKGVVSVRKGGRLAIHGGTVRVAKACQIYVAGELVIGGGTYINAGTLVVAREHVEIGRECAISWGCQILDDDMHHVVGLRLPGQSRSTTSPIVIGSRVLVGSRASILKGVRVGDGSVIASGAVVVSDVAAGTLVAGVPAREVRSELQWW